MITLTGKVAILTGAGRINGVGAATARLLAKQGCNILINSLTSKEQAAQIINLYQANGVVRIF